MIIKRKELYDKISEICDGEYAIGMHGIDYNRLRYFNDISRISLITDVMNNGLKVFNLRTIHGTVRFFGRIDTLEDEEEVRKWLEMYKYKSNDYFIVAVPTIYRNKAGEELFLGCPNLNSQYIEMMGSTGYQLTALLDDVLLRKGNIIDSSYVLGFCQVLEDGYVDFLLNPKHMAFNGGIVSDEVFRKVIATMTFYQYYYGINVSPSMFLTNPSVEDEENIKRIINDFERILYRTNNEDEKKVLAALCESLQQLINEKNLHKKSRSLECDKQGEERKLKV